MKEPLYYQAIKHSWKLAWEHKMLWLFGLFAAFLGQVGIWDLLSKVGLAAAGRPVHANFFAWLGFLKELALGATTMDLTADGWVWFFCLMLILLGFVIMLTFVSVVSQGAIIKASALSAKNKKLPDVDTAWHVGVKHFWRLLFINVVKKILFCILAIFVSWVTVKMLLGAGVGGAMLFLLVFILSSLIGLVITFLSFYAAAYVVVEEFKFGEALSSAWKLFIGHWLVSIEVGIIMIFMTIILGLVVLFGMMILFLPTLFSWLIAGWSYNYALAYAGLLVGTGLSAIFIIFAGSLFTIFNTSVWTYLFMKMHKVGIKSRIMHYLGK